ncbi:unnamed protein product, partial [Allacma fusca]
MTRFLNQQSKKAFC